MLLKRFAWRVRLARAWKGSAVGGCVAAGFAALWAGLDWLRVLETEWAWLACLVGGGAVIGAVLGLSRRIREGDLVDSIDRRARLENRLSTAREHADDGSAFGSAVCEDAVSHLSAVRPAQIYPLRLGRWHGGTVVLAAIAASLFILGNTPLLLSDTMKKQREDLKKEGQKVERITKENFETPEAKAEMSEEERKLADELRKYQGDLEKAHISKEESLQKANELARKADELSKMQAAQAQQNLAQAETALQKLQKEQLEKANLGQLDPSMAQMSPEERKQALTQNKQKQSDLEKQLSDLEKKLAEIQRKLKQQGLSKAQREELEKQRKALEAQKSALQKQLQQAKQEEQALKLSEEAMKVFEQMRNDPLFKQLMELQRKLKQDAGSAQQGNPSLSKEQREELRKQLEELAKKLKDKKAMQAYLKALLEAMKNAQRMGQCHNCLLGLTPMGGSSLTGDGPEQGAPSEDTWTGDRGWIHRKDKPVAGGGKTTTSLISGEKRETGPETYVEIKAPTLLGSRSSVPYMKVMPSYKRKAESALEHQQIPKEQEKRVKEYFEALEGKR